MTSTVHNIYTLFYAQRCLTQFSIDYNKEYLSWLRTSCVVFITTVATWHTWRADFWADFEQRKIGRAINEWQNDCGAASVPKDRICIHVVTFDTEKHLIIIYLLW